MLVRKSAIVMNVCEREFAVRYLRYGENLSRPCLETTVLF
jgi:hypothetical protein